jgi:predicted signal transduction protein with EAL and GGDEF domain
VPFRALNLQVSLSVGIAMLAGTAAPGPGDSVVDALVTAADVALYGAKRAGKGLTVMHQEPGTSRNPARSAGT